LDDNLGMSKEQEIKSILVKNMKKYREKQGLTQDDASEKAGITSKYWQRLEMKSQTDLPSLKTLFKVAEALKVSPSKMLDS